MSKTNKAITTPVDALREIVNEYEINMSFEKLTGTFEHGFRQGLKHCADIAQQGLSGSADTPLDKSPVPHWHGAYPFVELGRKLPWDNTLLPPPVGDSTCVDCGEALTYQDGDARFCCHCGKLLSQATAPAEGDKL